MVKLINIQENEMVIGVDGRIDSSNAPQFHDEAMDMLKSQIDDSHIVFDATELEYISSAGLRVFLQIKKKFANLEIINTSRDVYEIFDMTGFADMMTVKKALREVDVSNLPVVGVGGTATVYRLTEDSIIKVCKPFVTYDDIKKDQEMTRTAFKEGVPTMISFDIVKVGDCFGAIYELINAETVMHYLIEEKDKENKYCRMFAELMLSAHDATIKSSAVGYKNEEFLHKMDLLFEKGKLNEEELPIFKEIINAVPKEEYFVHGDCHPMNAMIQDGEPLFIDLGCIGKGNHLWDLVGAGWLQAAGEMLRPDQVVPFLGMEGNRAKRVWEKIVRFYLDGSARYKHENMDACFETIKELCIYLEKFNLYMAYIFAPDLFSEEVMQGMRRDVMDGYKLGRWQKLMEEWKSYLV